MWKMKREGVGASMPSAAPKSMAEMSRESAHTSTSELAPLLEKQNVLISEQNRLLSEQNTLLERIKENTNVQVPTLAE